MASHFRFTPIILVLAAVVGLVIWLYIPEQVTQQQAQSQKTPVSVVEVSQQGMEITVNGLGTALANEAVYITAQSSDVIDDVHFDDGEVVEQGQLLVSLNRREEQARVTELNVNLAEANRQLKRIENLARENATSKQLLDEQKARVDALSAQLEVANTRLQELAIRAPFSGQLGIRRVSPGALVNPGTVITTLDDLGTIKVDFSVAEHHLASLSKGQSITATSAAWPETVFEGRISSIDSRVDPVSRAVQVRALIPNPDLKLRPGMLLQVIILKQRLQTLVIPESAIVPIQDRHYVFVVEDDKATRKQVKLGQRKPGRVQVTEGLSEGDKVVFEGALRLRDGSLVQVLEN